MLKTYHLCFTSHKEVMYRNEEDMKRAFNCLCSALYRTGSRCLAENDLPNHHHGCYETECPGDLVQIRRQSYTRYFNEKYDRKGPLGDKGYFAAEIQGLRHKLTAISYTLGEPYTVEYFCHLAKQMEDMGADSICVKDMAGIMGPREGYDLVKALKENVKVPIVVHTHATTGLGYMTLFKCVEAGADVIDTAISSFSGGTSQPATETMAYALRKFGYENNLDIKECVKINDYFKAYKKKCFGDGTMSPVVMGTQSDALVYQIPGGMLSNLVAQLTAQNKLDKLDEVLEETPRVRKDLGYPPLVTPMSQMVGVQAATNVLSGERYKVVSKEIENYIRGEYGKAPGEVNPELQKKILGDEKPVECRYADLLEPGFEKAKAEIGSRARSDEDVLSYIAFPTQAEAFFEKRETKEKNTFNYKIARID